MQRSHNRRNHKRKPRTVSPCRHSRWTALYAPDERAEDDGRHARRPHRVVSRAVPDVAPPAGDSDPRREPEDHGDGFDADDGVLVRGGREAAGREREVGDGQERPDGAEEHEVDRVGRPGVVAAGAAVGIDYWVVLVGVGVVEGEVWDALYAVRPSTMMEKTAWIARRGRIATSRKGILILIGVFTQSKML
jgi:hypothetical protein